MNDFLLPGVLLAMTACSATPPHTVTKPDYATDRDRVQPSPVQFPAEIDPPPVTAPGSEDPGLTPPKPPAKPDPKQGDSGRS